MTVEISFNDIEPEPMFVRFHSRDYTFQELQRTLHQFMALSAFAQMTDPEVEFYVGSPRYRVRSSEEFVLDVEQGTTVLSVSLNSPLEIVYTGLAAASSVFVLLNQYENYRSNRSSANRKIAQDDFAITAMGLMRDRIRDKSDLIGDRDIEAIAFRAAEILRLIHSADLQLHHRRSEPCSRLGRGPRE